MKKLVSKDILNKIDFSKFLYNIPANDYIFQNTPYIQQIENSVKLICDADAILIGAGSGLSTAAGLSYSGKRFTDNFGEFIEKYGSSYMKDMYTSGFYPFPNQEAKWGYWSKHSFINRIKPDALPLYHTLYDLVKNKKHFVLTTNVDGQFQKAGFAKKNIFATQGDYGKIQCERGCHNKTYDAIDMFLKMNKARQNCLIPSYMVPKCPICGGNMTMYLRCDNYFVEDEYWNNAAKQYLDFLNIVKNKKVVLLECGVGFNTPIIIRFPFENMIKNYKNWSLIRLNLNEAFIPESFGDRAIGINADIKKTITDITERILQYETARKA